MSSFAANPRSILLAATSPKGSPSKAFEASRHATDKCAEAGSGAVRAQRVRPDAVRADGRLTSWPRGLAGRALRRAETDIDA